MSLVSVFVLKYQFDPSIFFISIWSILWKIQCNKVFLVSGAVTMLKGCHVLVSGFFELFIYFIF